MMATGLRQPHCGVPLRLGLQLGASARPARSRVRGRIETRELTQDQPSLVHTSPTRASNASLRSRKGSGLASDGMAAHVDEKWGRQLCAAREKGDDVKSYELVQTDSSSVQSEAMRIDRDVTDGTTRSQQRFKRS